MVRWFAGKPYSALALEVPDFKLTGDIGGTGNDEMDRYSAQIIAANEFLDQNSAGKRKDGQLPEV